MELEIFVVIIGLIMSFILFRRFPKLSETGEINKDYLLSIIIPARNEEKNLPLLLSDLRKQVSANFEIIVVDDGSTDSTREIAINFGVKVISVSDKPANWLGKSWACQKGAKEAGGNLFLFLDADVRLEKNCLRRIIFSYFEKNQPISILPYHQMKEAYEQLSLFFNLTQVSANGLAMKSAKKIGLYGPIILLSPRDYWLIGGHRSVKNKVIEDVALGLKMKEMKIEYRLFMGDLGITYRMYAGGFSDLYHGWLKNYGTAVFVTPVWRLIMVFLWVTSVMSVPIYMIISLWEGNFFYALIFLVFYLLWVVELKRICKDIGNFHLIIILCYPLSLSLFIIIFFMSMIKKVFHQKTLWKGRRV